MDHQIMVWKAAGKVDEQLVALPPQGIIYVFFSAVGQYEKGIAGKAIDNQSKDAALLLEGIKNIKSIRLDGLTNKDQNSFAVDVGVVYKNSNGEYRKKILINMIRRNNTGWKINPHSLLPLLDNGGGD